ncbi:MAG: DUF4892 domain-containing protein [Pseudomonadales bacterium]
MQKIFYSLMLSVCLAAGISPAHAQAIVSDEAGSADLEFLSRYRDSGIVRYEQSNSSDFLFALARVRKLNNRWQAEQERRVSGEYTSITYRAPDRIPSKSVFEHFSLQIEAAGFENLFECAGRSCGGSNKWANVIYSEKRLYGPDVNQRYLVAGKGNETLALYVIKRGNKRVYARIDYVVSRGPEQQSQVDLSWSEHLQRNGKVTVPLDSDDVQGESGELKQLVGWLSGSGKTLHVVGHAYRAGEGEASIDELKSRSLDSAISLRRRMIELGADASAIEAHGLGPLAPGQASGADRLELLIIDY